MKSKLNHSDFVMSKFVNIEQLYKAKADYYEKLCGKLEMLLLVRDGGDHDIDCKATRGRTCNCGHDSVAKLFYGG